MDETKTEVKKGRFSSVKGKQDGHTQGEINGVKTKERKLANEGEQGTLFASHRTRSHVARANTVHRANTLPREGIRSCSYVMWNFQISLYGTVRRDEFV